MKKYIVPTVETHKSECFAMLALSLQGGSADDSEILSREDAGWDVWSEDPAE